MKDLSDKVLMDMYHNTKSATIQKEVKKELLTRGYRFLIKDQWQLGWQTISAGATVGVLLLIGLIVFAFKASNNKPLETGLVNTQQILSVQQESDIVALKSEIALLRNQVGSLYSRIELLGNKNQELETRIVTVNERLWRFGVMNQENWFRINKGEKEMVTMSEKWFPNQKLRNLPEEVNTRMEQRKVIQETGDYNMPQEMK